MTPVIGITTGLRTIPVSAGDAPAHTLVTTYTTMVRRAGGIPVLLTPGDPAEIPALLTRLDGIVMSGGGDVDPARYGGRQHPSIYGVDPQRDEFELALAIALAERRVPTVCICRGLQVVNVAMGGTLIEDIAAEGPAMLPHIIEGEAAFHPQHPVTVETGSATAKALGREELLVNTLHHQAVRRVGSGLVVTGRSPDGIVEALAPEDASWPMWAVQWHPEYLGPGDEPSLALFETLVRAAG
ncbi:MAG TPA: gamma-glutamyl-gamma-aminobutyrate hydrolase family protein [Acidimicrobiia bacterium]|nr:gamma-glutamyl-gamma-aminobutyrate hydrolase family protein [Acidimicrobiia bacterium]